MLRRCTDVCEQTLNDAWGHIPLATTALNTIVLGVSALQEAAAPTPTPTIERSDSPSPQHSHAKAPAIVRGADLEESANRWPKPSIAQCLFASKH